MHAIATGTIMAGTAGLFMATTLNMVELKILDEAD